MTQQRIFSGIQPTGHIHLGNYLGALRNWVSLQQSGATCFFCIVDLHALTVRQDPLALRKNILEMAATLIACGIDLQKSILFVQSSVTQHAELAWILGCIARIGWLQRMTQFKEKAEKDRENVSVGLLTYPILMAADILLYKADLVPVGDDQLQHLEMARDIAQRFNHDYGRDFFPLCRPKTVPEAARIMSLKDGTKKMSKSDPSDYARIHLTDTPDVIALKIQKAKTDSAPLAATPEDLEHRPEAKNLMNLYAALAGQSLEDICRMWEGKLFSVFKKDLTDLCVTTLNPLRQRLEGLLKDPSALQKLLEASAQKARGIAAETMKQVRAMTGLL